MPDFLMDFFAEKHFRTSSAASTTETTRKEWYAKSVSAKKISFELNVCQRQAFSQLEEVLNAKTSSNGLVTLIPECFSVALIFVPSVKPSAVKGAAEKCHAS